MRATELTRAHIISARRSLNLELQSWSNGPGVNLWEVDLQTVTLVQGTATYVIDSATVSVLDTYFSTVDGGGDGIDTDRLMLPISRTEYAMIPNKAQQGLPTVYWFQRLNTPQITFWQNPQYSAPDYYIKFYRLKRVQDAYPITNQTPDIPYRFLDALCARLARRLAVKFAPAKVAALQADATEAWNLAITTDQEFAPITVAPQLNSYWQQ